MRQPQQRPIPPPSPPWDEQGSPSAASAGERVPRPSAGSQRGPAEVPQAARPRSSRAPGAAADEPRQGKEEAAVEAAVEAAAAKATAGTPGAERPDREPRPVATPAPLPGRRLLPVRTPTRIWWSWFVKIIPSDAMFPSAATALTGRRVGGNGGRRRARAGKGEEGRGTAREVEPA